jgi:inactivated superfamily I helicase
MPGLDAMRLFRAGALVGGAFILLVQSASAQGVNPSAVVDSYERAWTRQDIDSALDHFAANAVITLQDTRTRALTSRQQIREFLETDAPVTPAVLTAVPRVEGGSLLWSERTAGEVLNSPDLTIRAVVQNGKIESLEYRRGRLITDTGPAAAGLTVEAAAMALGGVLLFALGLLSLATSHPHVTIDSKLRGSLLRDLRGWRTTAKRGHSGAGGLEENSRCR